MKEPTDNDYVRISGCSNDFRLPSFTFGEIKSFLESLDYRVIIHKGLVNSKEVYYKGNEVNYTGNSKDIMRERILAIKPSQTLEDLPKRIDSPEAGSLCFHEIFNGEIKKKLLNL